MNNGEVPGSGSGFVARLLSELTGNPINVVLLGVCGYLLYRLLKGRQEDDGPPVPDDSLPPLPKKDMTVEELKKYDGRQEDGRILMAVNGKIFDVTRGKQFYGPGGPYGVFAGRDASRGLATFSLTEDAIKDEFDDLSDLNATEMDTVRDWDAQFTMKYDYIGRLIKSHEEEKSSDKGVPLKDVKPVIDSREKDKEKPVDLTPPAKDAEKKPSEAEKKPSEAEKKPTDTEKKPTDAEKKQNDVEKKPVHPEQPSKVVSEKSRDVIEHSKAAEKPQSSAFNLPKIVDQPSTQPEKSPKDEPPKELNKPSVEPVKPLIDTTKKLTDTEKKPIDTEKKPIDTEKKPIDTEKKPVHLEQPSKLVDEKSRNVIEHSKDAEKPQSSAFNLPKIVDHPSTQPEISPKDELPKDSTKPSGEPVKPLIDTTKKTIDAEKKPTDTEKKLADVEKKPVHPEQPSKVVNEKLKDVTTHSKDAQKPPSSLINLPRMMDQPLTQPEKSPKGEPPKESNKPLGEPAKPAGVPFKPMFGYEEPSKVEEQPSSDETSSRDLLRDPKKSKK